MLRKVSLLRRSTNVLTAGKSRDFKTQNQNNDKSNSSKMVKPSIFVKSNSILETARKTAYNFGFIFPENYSHKEIKTASYHLIHSIYKQANQLRIYEVAGLDDHYDIWFRFVMLHLWVFFVRFQNEGRDGKLIIDNMSKILWFDVEKRIKELHTEQKRNMNRRQMKEDYLLTYYLFGNFDEGILGSDAQLASNLWSVFYSKNKGTVEAWHVEALVSYVRFTVNRMDNIDFKKLIPFASQFEWTLPADF